MREMHLVIKVGRLNPKLRNHFLDEEVEGGYATLVLPLHHKSCQTTLLAHTYRHTQHLLQNMSMHTSSNKVGRRWPHAVRGLKKALGVAVASLVWHQMNTLQSPDKYVRVSIVTSALDLVL